MLFANTVAELVNVSPTGALIRLGFKPRLGGEWPLAIELPARGQVWLNGRVVRCELDSMTKGTTEDGTVYLLALAFVQPSERAQTLLDQICGATTMHTPASDGLPRRWLARHRLRRVALSLRRQCPECRSTTVTKQTDHRYSCDQCGSDFAGFHLGALRISL
jgi:hypothetical protein